MTQTTDVLSPGGHAFIDHMDTFHGTLPADEQRMLEHLVALAVQATRGEVQGFGAQPHMLGGISLFTIGINDVLISSYQSGGHGH